MPHLKSHIHCSLWMGQPLRVMADATDAVLVSILSKMWVSLLTFQGERLEHFLSPKANLFYLRGGRSKAAHGRVGDRMEVSNPADPTLELAQTSPSLVQCGTPENPRQSAERYAFGSICKNSPAINLSNSIWGSHNFLHSGKLLFISNIPEGNWPIAYFNCRCHYVEPDGKTYMQLGDFSTLDLHRTGH